MLLAPMAACTLGSEGTRSTSSVAASSSSTGPGGAGAGGTDGGSGAASSSSGGAGAEGAADAGAGGTSGCDAPDVLDPNTGHCYRLFEVDLLYADVDASCATWQVGGRFAAVSTEVEYDFLQGQYPLFTDFWIGADDLDTDGTWAWVNGETWGEATGWGQSPNAPWKAGEPAGGGGEMCLRMKNWLFESKNCDAQYYLCERP